MLRITAIDTATGELVVFDGIPASDSSTRSPPAARCRASWPPVTIGDRRYMDGGVGSTVNMALAEDCDAVVALVPSGESTPSPFGGGAAEEIAAFRGSTLGVFADDESLAAFGPNPLDPACRKPSARGRAGAGPAGRRRDRRIPRRLNQLSSVGFELVEHRRGQFLADVDDLGGAVELQAAAGACAAPRSAGRADRPPACAGPAPPARCRWCGSSPRSCPAWAPTSSSGRCRSSVVGRWHVPIADGVRSARSWMSSSAEVLRHIRFSHSVVALGSVSVGSSRPPASLPARLIAMVRSALTAAIGAIGSGSRMPPSASSRPSSTCGEITPGIAIDARMAASTGPRCSHTDLPDDQVGGNSGVGDRQLFDRHLAEDVADRVEDLLRPQHAGGGDRRVQQPQHRALRQRLGPVGEFVELVRRLQAADERAHRRSGDPDDVVAAVTELIDHADVGVSAGAAAAESQRDTVPGHTAILRRPAD